MDSKGPSTPVLLNALIKPAWFDYPIEFLAAQQAGFGSLWPWKILSEPDISTRMFGLKKRYEHRDLVPFALRLDCDDVACWDRVSFPKVAIVHDFASPGWESREVFESFSAWHKRALEDSESERQAG